MPAESLGAAEGAVAVRRRDGEHPAESAAAVGRRRRLLAQGRHARERRAEGDPQLRAHRPGARRQHAPRAHQRSRRPQQHRDEGARARLRRHEPDAASCATMLDPHQGARASGLRVRVGRRLAGAAHPPGADPRRRRRSSSTPITCRCAATATRRSARRSSRCASATESEHRVAEGDGPVNALDAALRAALVATTAQLERRAA